MSDFQSEEVQRVTGAAASHKLPGWGAAGDADLRAGDKGAGYCHGDTPTAGLGEDCAACAWL